MGFLKPGLIADGKFNKAYSFLFVVPENQVWAEISMGDVRGKGIWLVDIQVGSLQKGGV